MRRGAYYRETADLIGKMASARTKARNIKSKHQSVDLTPKKSAEEIKAASRAALKSTYQAERAATGPRFTEEQKAKGKANPKFGDWKAKKGY